MKQLRDYQKDALNTLRKRLKETVHPLLVTASVGAGKSLIIAELLLIIERAGYKALCLTMNSTLIQQNSEAYKLQGGTCGIYCSALNEKCIDKPVLFASPNSIIKEFPKINFNLIIIDECHNVNFNNDKTMYMRILNHYGYHAQLERYNFRVVGLTGTPYRSKNISIVGENQYFKEEICNISTQWLIQNKFLVPIKFGLSPDESYDFTKLKIMQTGKFDQKQLQNIVDHNVRLTGKIMHELIEVMQEHRGCFIFAASKKHCMECAKSLPDNEWAIITGDTNHDERKNILQQAKSGTIKYLINVNCLVTGVDLPEFDVCAWLRPTESLVLYIQGIGRVLRLCENKSFALVLDYAGNIERHGDLDNPIINEAVKPNDKNINEFCIPCYDCNTLNTIFARRCIGTKENARCNHYFDFKECPKCQNKNDQTSRQCRICENELIDPNKKLKIKKETFTLTVINIKYWTSGNYNSKVVFNAQYTTNAGNVFESFYINDLKTQHIFYGRFIKLHFEEYKKYFNYLNKPEKIKQLVYDGNLKSPHTVICTKDDNGRYKIRNKLFN